MAVKPNKVQDLDLDAIVTTERYNKDIEALGKRMELLESRFGSNESIANTLCETSKTAVRMQEMLDGSFLRMLCNNEQVKDSIVKLVNPSDRNWFYSFLKMLGIASWILVFFILGVLVKVAVDHYLKVP